MIQRQPTYWAEDGHASVVYLYLKECCFLSDFHTLASIHAWMHKKNDKVMNDSNPYDCLHMRTVLAFVSQQGLLKCDHTIGAVQVPRRRTTPQDVCKAKYLSPTNGTYHSHRFHNGQASYFNIISDFGNFYHLKFLWFQLSLASPKAILCK